MSLLARKRILIDIKNFNSEKLEGVFAWFDDSDIYKAKALIIGPEDTPYSNGFYFFDIEFPKNYPLYPPKVLFRTVDNRIRFNPNLYKDGKVCVSILGTWSGPGWTSVMTFSNVLLSIQSLLNYRPIQNEPGWENEVGDRCEVYNKIIHYYNYEVAILNMFKTPPLGFEVFQEEMKDYLRKNINKIITVMNDSKHLDSQFLKANIYGLQLKPNYNNLIYEFTKIKQDILPIDSESLTINPCIKDKRKSPNEPSKKYSLGTILKSENDGNYWKVIKFGEKTRWSLLKNYIEPNS